TPLATEAYNAALSLKLNEATRLIEKMKVDEPNNYACYFIENYVDFFKLFIGENIADFNALKNNKAKRLKLLSQTSQDSPYYLYCKAEINLQWALVRLKFEEYSKAFFEVRSAYNDLQTNVQKFPTFIANKK